MRIVYIICFFIIGAVMGSFYNVLGLRIVKKESIIKPKSHCEKCGHILSWYELIPIFSFIFLKGRCHNCKTKLSFLYIFSEFFCGLLFAISYYSFGFSPELIISITLSSLLIIVTVCDVTYMIIPDRFIIISGVLILLTKLIFFGSMVFLKSLLNGVLAFVIMYLIMKLGDYVFKKETLGGADVKLMFVVGISLEPFLALLVIIIASMIALPISLVLLVKEKEHAIPFGPFILIGTMIVFLTKLDGLKIINFLIGK
jgi:leader peptidase (prepilin peptidase)/N-methyltransferase